MTQDDAGGAGDEGGGRPTSTPSGVPTPWGSLPLASEPTEPDDALSTWVALFYDLVFVAAILIFTRAVEQVHPQTGAFWIVAVFTAAWWIWYSTTVLAHRLQLADLPHRLLLLVQMLVIVLMAMEARVSVDGDSSTLGVEYAALLGTVALMYLRAHRGGGRGSVASGRLALINLVAAVVVLVASGVPEPVRTVCYLVGLLVSVVGTGVVWHGGTVVTAGDERHFIERMAAFTLIVCGEAFIESALAVSGPTIVTVDVASLAFEFVLVFALFSAYFESVPSAGIDPSRFRSWSALHLVLQVAVAASAVSATKVIADHLAGHVPDAEILRLTAPLAVFFLAMAGLDACTRRRPVTPMAVLHLLTAGTVAVVGAVAWYLPPVHLDEALPLLDVVAVAYLVVAARVRRGTEVLPLDDPARA